MKITSKITSAIAAFGLVAVLATGTASAIGEGQIEGGDIYRIKNLTKNSAFMDPAFADKCESVQYKVRFHNPGPGIVNNVNVKVVLPDTVSTKNVSTMTVTAQNAQPATRTDTATLNISTAQKVSYVGGSTQLLDTHSNVLSSLPDGITTGGINIGSVGVSLNEIKFVQFKANIGCPPAEKQPAFSCDVFKITSDVNRTVKVTTFETTATNGAVFSKADVNWGDNSAVTTDTNIVGKTHQYNKDGTFTITATAHFTVNGEDKTASGPNCVQQVTFKGNIPPEVTPPAPTTLVNTGPGSVAGMFAAVTVAGAAAHRWFLARRLNRQ